MKFFYKDQMTKKECKSMSTGSFNKFERQVALEALITLR